jgi:hypothetical protein
MTAVEWYSNKLVEILGDMCNEFTLEQTLANHYALKQALEMEKHQIIDAYIEGYSSNLNAGDSEKYYNETYKKDKP